MKLYKPFLRLMIAASSVAGFVGGWAFLANSPNPKAAAEPPVAASPAQIELPTLAPLFSSRSGFDEQSESDGFRPLKSLPQARNFAQPRFQTRGS